MNLRFILLFLGLFPALLHADDVVFFKNSGQYRMFVWVNGAYQGWVNAGTTAYMPREGFVTQDSGFQPDGTLKTTHSHGGWEAGGLFEYKAFSASFEKDGTKVAYYSTGTVPYKIGDKRVGIAPGKGVTAELPSDYDMETASKMQGEGPPGDLHALLSVGKEEVPYQGGANPAGSITDGASFPMWYAGAKKKEEIDLTGIDILGTIRVTERILVIEAWDHGTPDGDQVAVLLNDVSIYPLVNLTTNKQALQVNLKDGNNKLEIIALNEGSLGTNTASFNVFSNQQLITRKQWDLNTKERAVLLVIKN